MDTIGFMVDNTADTRDMCQCQVVGAPVRKRLDHRGPLSIDVSGAWYFITICAEGHKPWVATKWEVLQCDAIFDRLSNYITPHDISRCYYLTRRDIMSSIGQSHAGSGLRKAGVG